MENKEFFLHLDTIKNNCEHTDYRFHLQNQNHRHRHRCPFECLNLYIFHFLSKLFHFLLKKIINSMDYLFVCFCGCPLSKELGIQIGILPTSGAGVDGNAPYQEILGYKQTSYLLGWFNPNTT